MGLPACRPAGGGVAGGAKSPDDPLWASAAKTKTASLHQWQWRTAQRQAPGSQYRLKYKYRRPKGT
jgi:hypothetical protein